MIIIINNGTAQTTRILPLAEGAAQTTPELRLAERAAQPILMPQRRAETPQAEGAAQTTLVSTPEEDPHWGASCTPPGILHMSAQGFETSSKVIA